MTRTSTHQPLRPRADDISKLLVIESFIRQASWAKDLSQHDFETTCAEIHVRDYATGATVVSKGGKVDAWIGVVSGLVKINSVSPDGKTVTFTGVPPGGWLGEGSMLKSEPRKYDVVAIRPSRIAFLPRRAFQRLLDTSIGFNQFLIMQLNERLGQFIGMVEYYRLLGPDARVAQCIASLYNPLLYPDHSHDLKISQEELGYLCGISRQRVNQALNRLEQVGLVGRVYGGINVLDLQGLRDYTG